MKSIHVLAAIALACATIGAVYYDANAVHKSVTGIQRMVGPLGVSTITANSDGGIAFKASGAEIRITNQNGGNVATLQGTGSIRIYPGAVDAGLPGRTVWLLGGTTAGATVVSGLLLSGSTATGNGGAASLQAGTPIAGGTGGDLILYSGAPGVQTGPGDAGIGVGGLVRVFCNGSTATGAYGCSVRIGADSWTGGQVEIGKSGNNLSITFAKGEIQTSALPSCTQGQQILWEGDAGVWQCAAP